MRGAFLTSNFVTTSDTFVTVTELNNVLSFKSGFHYALEGRIRYSGSLSGIDFSLEDNANTSLETSNATMISDITASVSKTIGGSACNPAYDDAESPSGTSTIRVSGFFLADSDGALLATVRREVAASSVTLLAGTHFILTKLD